MPCTGWRRWSARTAALLLLWAGAAAAAGTSPPAGDAAAAAARLQDLLARVQRRYRSLPSFSVTFVERYRSSTFGSQDQARGVVKVTPPDKMLWLYDEPKGQKAALDGNQWWLVAPADQQVIVREIASAGADPLAGILAGRLDLGQAFLVQPAPGTAPAGRVLLDLVPRSPREDFDRAVLEVDDRDGAVRRLDIVDPLGNRTTFELGRPSPSPPPPPEAFTLVVPPGFTITKE